MCAGSMMAQVPLDKRARKGGKEELVVKKGTAGGKWG